MEHPSVPHTPPLLPSLLSPLVSGTLTPKTHGVPKNPWSHDVSPKLCRRHRPTTLAVHPPFIMPPSPTSTSTLPPLLLHPPYISRVWANHGSKQSCKKKKTICYSPLPACLQRAAEKFTGWLGLPQHEGRSIPHHQPPRSLPLLFPRSVQLGRCEGEVSDLRGGLCRQRGRHCSRCRTPFF